MAPDPSFGEGWMQIPDPIAGASPPPPRRVEPRGPSLTRAQVRTRRIVAILAALAWSGLVLAMWGLRPELAEKTSFVAAQSLVFGLVLHSAVQAALSAGRRGLGLSVSRARRVALGAPVGFAIVGLVWLPSDSPGSFGDLGPARAIVSCISLGLLVVVPVLAAALWAMQRAFPTAASWRGAALGAGVGLCGSLMLTLHCSSPFGGHVALAHGLPIVIAAVAGALLAKKVARA